MSKTTHTEIISRWDKYEGLAYLEIHKIKLVSLLLFRHSNDEKTHLESLIDAQDPKLLTSTGIVKTPTDKTKQVILGKMLKDCAHLCK